MWQRCKQVAINYLTRKMLLLFLGCYLLMTVPLVFLASSRPDQVSRMIAGLFPPLFFLMYIGFLLGAHLKQQFSNPRARLLPGFGGPHLLVSMLFFVAALAWSVLPAWGTPTLSPIGFLAISLHLGMLGLWIGSRPNAAVIVLLLLSSILPTTAVGRGLVVEIATGAEPIMAFSMISAHVASLVLLLSHLVAMNEDDPDYSKVQSLDMWDMRAATQRNFQRNVALSGNWMLTALSASAAGRLDRATAVPATTPRQRAALFGLGDNYPSPFLMNMIVILLLEVVLLLMGGQQSIRSTQNFRTALFLPMWISFALVWGQWMPRLQRWPRLGYESLRPVSRREWVWENGVAIAKTIVLNQAVAILIQLLLVALFLPQFLMEPSLWEAVMWWSGGQVLLFGICAWLTSYGSLLVLGFAMVPCFVLLAAPWGISTMPSQVAWSIPLTACLSFGAALLGLVVSRFAFQRWCRMDLP